MSGTRPFSGLLTVALCLLTCMLVGALACGGRIFDPSLSSFQFIAGGLVGGAFLVAIQARRLEYVAGVGVVAFALTSAISESWSANLLVRNAVWVIALLVAVLGALRIEDGMRRVSFGKFVLWAVVFGIVYLCALGVLRLLRPGPVNPEVVIANLKLGVLVGAGIGLGHEIAERARWHRQRLSSQL
jgi:hypothetical protein